MKSQFKKCSNETKAKLDELMSEAGAEGLIKALNSGVLEIKVFQTNPQNTEQMIVEYAGEVGSIIKSSYTYPLMDYTTCNLVQQGLKEGLFSITDASVNRAKHIALAANLLKRLPVFDNATIDEILDIRRELDKPLIRFRSAILKFSNNVDNEPWSEDFKTDADIVFMKEIEPVVLELEEECRANSYLKQLIKKAVDKPLVVPAGSALGLVMAPLSNFLGIATEVLGTTIGAGLLAHQAAMDYKNTKEKIEKNQLFFYYQAGKKLSK